MIQIMGLASICLSTNSWIIASTARPARPH